MNDSKEGPLRSRLRTRLEELKSELAEGKKMGIELDNRRAELRDSMLRISGAMHVLEEQLAVDDGQGAAK